MCIYGMGVFIFVFFLCVYVEEISGCGFILCIRLSEGFLMIVYDVYM